MDSVPTLVVLAAGLGRRYGGPKQLAQVGPAGEPLFVLTGRQAAAAGVRHVIVVTRSDLEREMRSAASALAEVHVDFVLQDRSGPARARPWGTAHAVIACAGLLDGPFVVANADDHYGDPSISLAVAAACTPDDHTATVIGFRLDQTLSAHGPVTRAMILTDESGRVVGLDERRGLCAEGERIIDGHGTRFPADSLVSMNLFALPSSLPSLLAASFDRFVASHDAASTEELLLPDELDRLTREGALTLQVVATDAPWVGLTHRGDEAAVRASLNSGNLRR
jgi:NDP-sugar pyrophosphorylase family protein